MFADPRAQHLRRVHRRRRSAQRWSVLAAVLSGATLVLIPYAGLGAADAVWSAAAGGSAALAVLGWRDHRRLSALPVPAADPAVLGVGRIVRGAVEQFTRHRTRQRFRGSAAAGCSERLQRAGMALAVLAPRLPEGPANDALADARGLEATLRDLAERVVAVEGAVALAPDDASAPLEQARGALLAQLEDGVTAYERLVAAAAACVAEDGRLGEHAARARLTEATEKLRGFASGLAEVRDLSA